MFFTSVIDSDTGEECWDQTYVANEYMSTARYKFDVLAVFGAKILKEYVWTYFKYFALAKLTRVVRVNAIIAKANVENYYKNLLKLGRIFFFLVFYLHIVACYWW